MDREFSTFKQRDKTLYISDLDGTLLNKNAELSEYAVSSLNKLIDTGIHFSVATARTAATAIHILKRVSINVPIILMNGVLVYDTNSMQYVRKELLEKSKVNEILSAIKNTGQNGLMYAFTDDVIDVYYERLDNIKLKAFVETRIKKYNKRFTQIHDFGSTDSKPIYFCFLDTKNEINRLQKEIGSIIDVHYDMAQDIYADDLWFLEIFSKSASKGSPIQFLRERYGFEKVVGFGDNTNDLPLFAACDECYAVANAIPEVKNLATSVIGSNVTDGVVKWLEENA